jgi:hypothetical protein
LKLRSGGRGPDGLLAETPWRTVPLALICGCWALHQWASPGETCAVRSSNVSASEKSSLKGVETRLEFRLPHCWIGGEERLKALMQALL